MSQRWLTLEKRVNKRFQQAIDKKGYLSLCSIIESQYSYPQKYRLEPKKQYNATIKQRKQNTAAPQHPQPEQFRNKHPRKKLKKTYSGDNPKSYPTMLDMFIQHNYHEIQHNHPSHL